jgi:ABC-2 type transport system ATP-binding protein
MKCELVAALLYSPKIVFLDEPTIGLDVVSQKRIRDFLKQLHDEDNCTILLTSHYMQDVQELCNRVVVIDEGTTIFEGTLDDLTRRYSDVRKLRLTFSEPVELADVEPFGQVTMPEPTVAVIEVQRDKMAKIITSAMQKLPVNDVAIEEVEIEDVIRDLFTSNRAE